MNKSPLELLFGFLGLAAAFTLDRLSKSWALTHLQASQSTIFLPGLLNLRLVHNTGAAFSLGRDNGQLMTTVAALVTISLVAWMTNRYRRAAHSAPLERIGAGILLGGALGNLYDRFTLGQVTDFLEFSFMTFPIFNVADALIDLGIVLIFFAMIKEMRQSHAGN